MRRDDLAPGLRVIGFRRTAAITFVVEADEVIISGIFYGGQNYDETLPIGEA
jgi:toxin ParE1/3/4